MRVEGKTPHSTHLNIPPTPSGKKRKTPHPQGACQCLREHCLKYHYIITASVSLARLLKHMRGKIRAAGIRGHRGIQLAQTNLRAVFMYIVDSLILD